MKNKIIEILVDINSDIREYQGEDLIEDGMLDSLEIMAVVNKIEETFNIEFTADDIIMENFKSVSTLADLVNEKISMQ